MNDPVQAAVHSSTNELLTLYGNRLRVRVCGLYREGDRLLLVRHKQIGPANSFWSPPGGGVGFGESAPKALVREFAEETGLAIEVGDMLFVNEFIAPPLHAVELFFDVQNVKGVIQPGIDPEMNASTQIIEDVQLLTFSEIKQYPPNEVHAVFSRCKSLDDVFQLRGYLFI